jgi:hypothetical protein
LELTLDASVQAQMTAAMYDLARDGLGELTLRERRDAKLLHDEGDIAALFGNTIPVIVHELEYYDQIADQTIMANPRGVADEFAAWVRSH